MKFKVGKETLDIDVDTEETVLSLKAKLQDILQLDTIKLIHSGKVLHDGSFKLMLVPGGNSAKLTVVATSSKFIEEASQQQQSQISTSRVIDDLNNDSSEQSAQLFRRKVVTTAKHIKQSEYRFHSIETLPDLPDRDRALEILTELSNDPGVLAVMEKHKWTVGTLCELYPKGYVGVSDVCVMGLNENKGQRILLRLRTDDLKGFRKILSIKKVLYHELAHNVHSEHDSNFYVLMRQIEKEVAVLDWRNSAGHTTGYESRYSSHTNTLHDRGDSKYYEQRTSGAIGGTYRLGGGSESDALLQQFVSAKYLAGTAAIMRLSAEEQEVEDNCGSGRGHNVHCKDGIHGTDSATSSSSSSSSSNSNSGGVSSNGRVAPTAAETSVVEQAVSDDIIDMDVVEMMSIDATFAGGTVTAVSGVAEEEVMSSHRGSGGSSSDFAEEGTALSIEAMNTVLGKDSTVFIEVKPDAAALSTETNTDSVSASTDVNTHTAQVELPSKGYVATLSQTIQSSVLSTIDESISFALSLESSAAPVDKLFQLRTAVEKMLQSTAFTDMVQQCSSNNRLGNGNGNGTLVEEPVFLKCLKLLLKVIGNAKDHLDSTSADALKYRTIKKTTGVFSRYIQSVPNAVDILYAAGFTDSNISSAGAGSSGGNAAAVIGAGGIPAGDTLVLTRKDPGLLYIVQSMLSNVIETAEKCLGDI